jgi:predicted RNA methylase
MAEATKTTALSSGYSLWPGQSVDEQEFDVGKLRMRLRTPTGTFPITPASRVCIDAMGTYSAQLFKGVGVDWGCGGGALAIAACLASDSISKVYGLDVMRPNIEVAKRNAELNGVQARTEFVEADCFAPVERGPREALAAAAPFDFILANPPADAEAGDGFGWRRRIAKDAVQLLKPGAPLILQALSAYGEQRFGALAGSGLSQWRTLHRHGPVEMDLSREDLQVQLRQYAAFEAAGGEPYVFDDADGKRIDAREAWRRYEASGERPRVWWTVQIYYRDEE